MCVRVCVCAANWVVAAQIPGAAALVPIGRLDYDAEGLLLLTSSGDLAAAVASRLAQASGPGQCCGPLVACTSVAATRGRVPLGQHCACELVPHAHSSTPAPHPPPRAQVYSLRVEGTVTGDVVAALRRGVTVSDVRHPPLDVAVRGHTGSSVWMSLTLPAGGRVRAHPCVFARARLLRVSIVGVATLCGHACGEGAQATRLGTTAACA